MSVSVMIMLILGSIFIVAFLVFFLTSKKQSVDKPVNLNEVGPHKDIDIEVKSAIEDTVERKITIEPTKPAPVSKMETTPIQVSAQKPSIPPKPTVPSKHSVVDSKQDLPPKKKEILEPEQDDMFGSEFDMESSGISPQIDDSSRSSSETKDFGGLMHGSSAGFEYESEKPPTPVKAKPVRPEEIVFSFDDDDAPMSTITEISMESDDIFSFEDDDLGSSGSPVAPVVAPPIPIPAPTPVAPPVTEKADIPSEAFIDSILDQRSGSKKAQIPPVVTPVVETPVVAAVETPQEAPVMDPEEEKAHEKARRIARVIINDIRNYNPEKLAEGIRIGNIIKLLGAEIEMGRQLYVKRVSPEIARSTNYYRENLIKILADGRPDLLGL